MCVTITVISEPTAFAQAQTPAYQPLVKLGPIPAAAQFDSTAASNKYFEGGYWIMLWSAIYTIAIALLLLFTSVSRRMRDLAARLTRFKWLQAWIYFAEFMRASTILSLPWNIYVGFYRERIYNQSHQAFAGWLGDQLIGTLAF
jgi:STE24 endopeptidase